MFDVKQSIASHSEARVGANLALRSQFGAASKPSIAGQSKAKTDKVSRIEAKISVDYCSQLRKADMKHFELK